MEIGRSMLKPRSFVTLVDPLVRTRSSRVEALADWRKTEEKKNVYQGNGFSNDRLGAASVHNLILDGSTSYKLDMGLSYFAAYQVTASNFFFSFHVPICCHPLHYESRFKSGILAASRGRSGP